MRQHRRGEKMNHRTLLTALAVAAAVVAYSRGAEAQTLRGNVVVFDEATKIEGEIEKPEAFYILYPTTLDYQEAKPEESFLDEIYRATKSDPF